MIGDDPRPCERQCKGPCGQWLHHSRFRSFRSNPGRHGTMSNTVSFRPWCKACEHKQRDELKNFDRPKSIIENRARAAAAKARISYTFFWTQMNYRALVPVFRAMMTDEGLCLDCGHKFMNERDIQIEHQAPPRNKQDWARLHTRNLRLACTSCNNGKGITPYEDWLDQQEDARKSNLTGSKVEDEPKPEVIQPKQLPLFFELP
jgi:5-methylcytosine-specific restriction endonuclease McrA